MADSAFVFVYLPGDTAATACGRFDPGAHVTPHQGRFIYAASYLEDSRAVPIDPVALPLRAEAFSTSLTLGYFGTLLDAIPDAWGKLVAARLYGDSAAEGLGPLLLPGADRLGALAFGASAEAPVEGPDPVQWDEVCRCEVLEAIDRIDRGVALSEAEAHAALRCGAGTSAGGARPKLTVQRDEALWLAKLNRHGDPWNVVRTEAAMLDLARRCGISVPDHRVERARGHDVLLVRRIDRNVTPFGIERCRAVSAATVFRADEPFAQYAYTGSYLRLARELARWSDRARDDRRELFRRVAFNCLCSITDDHERNHALIAPGRHFRLSSAFDLVPRPAPTVRRYLAMAIGELGALPTRENLLSAADVFEIARADARQIIDELVGIVGQQWREACRACGVSDADQAKIAGCFVPEIFEKLRSEIPGSWVQ